MMHFRNNLFFFAKTLVDILAKVGPLKARILTLGSSPAGCVRVSLAARSVTEA
jgi:hypothetical protein